MSLVDGLNGHTSMFSPILTWVKQYDLWPLDRRVSPAHRVAKCPGRWRLTRGLRGPVKAHFMKRLAPLKVSLRVSVFEKSLLRRDGGI
jgi:hypothetical protein